MASKDHKKSDIHRYILKNQGVNKEYLVYRCMHANGACGHYIKAEDAVGRDTICWRCGKVCQVPKMRRNRYVVRPHCITCTKEYKQTIPSSRPIDLKKLAEMSLDDLLAEDDLFSTEDKKEH